MPDPKNILVIRFSSIGDIVLASPLLRVLRGRFPSAQIDFVARSEYADLVRFNHNLNYTHAFDASEGFAGLQRLKRRIAQERYDLIVDIHGSLRSRYLRAFRNGPEVVTFDKRVKERTALVKLKRNRYKNVVSVADRYIEPLSAFGVVPDGKGLELHITDEVLFGVNGRMATYRLDRFERVFGLCPGSRHMTKRWPGERYGALAAGLVQTYDGAVVLFGGNQEKDSNGAIAAHIAETAGKERVIDLTGSCTLLETAAAMEYVDVIVTNDSGLMHIAAARQKPLVAIFGSTVREFGFFPVSASADVLEVQGLSCRPCSHIGRDSCPEGHFRCMLDTRVETVLGRVDLLVKRQ